MSRDAGVFERRETMNGKVIPMMQPSSSAQFPGCRDLEAYWTALRGARQMPARSEFDPRGVEASLASTFIAERVAPRVARIRVAGSSLTDMLGMDVRGMPITAFFDPASRDVIADAMSTMFEQPAQMTVTLSAKRGFGRRPEQARLLLLPLCDQFGEVTRVVGCLEKADEQRKLPNRFAVEQVVFQDIEGTPPRKPAKPASELNEFTFPVQRAREAQAVLECAEPAPPAFRSSRRKAADHPNGEKRAHLKLVVNN